MSVERLFFGQKYVVFWAKHLISILGIRFGGSRDEILTFGIAIRVITPPYNNNECKGEVVLFRMSQNQRPTLTFHR